MALKTLWKFSFDHRNKFDLKIYSNRKPLFKLVIIFQHFSVLTIFFNQINAALVSRRDTGQRSYISHILERKHCSWPNFAQFLSIIISYMAIMRHHDNFKKIKSHWISLNIQFYTDIVKVKCKGLQNDYFQTGFQIIVILHWCIFHNLQFSSILSCLISEKLFITSIRILIFKGTVHPKIKPCW